MARKISFRSKSYFLVEKWNLLIPVTAFQGARKRFNKWHALAEKGKGKSIKGYVIFRERLLLTNNEWQLAGGLYNERDRENRMKMREQGSKK